MNIYMNQLNKLKRNPNNFIYNIFLTLILAILIIWLIYIFVPYKHYNLYIIEPQYKLI